MGSLSIWHWLIFLVVVLLMFGGSGKISAIMGDMAKGIKSFRKGLADDEEEAKKKAEADAVQRTIDVKPSETVKTSETSKTA
ncbi:MAG: twin-arginine translocase TatA/TatE family subunit [Hyphomicrobium aestuarii]|nr:twin-arginine translocase TatA/TatE family subunit [Hyphomicrobium aestuarii]